MKIGSDPAADVERVRSARDAIGPDAELFVDANGAYDRKQALAKAAAFADLGVSWFEEPVSSDDLEGLRLIREQAPAGMRIAAGEYGYDSFYFRRMLEAGRGGRAPGRRHTLCGHYRFSRRRQFVRLLLDAIFRAHCAFAARARGLRASVARSMSSIFSTTTGSSRCSSMAPSCLRVACSARIPSRPGFGLECKLPDMEKYKVYGNAAA